MNNNSTASTTLDKLEQMTTDLESTVKNVKNSLSDTLTQARDVTNQSVKATDQYVHENPWTSLLIATAAGLVVGCLMGRLK